MSGLNDRITGRTKQMAGIMTGSKKLEAEGHAQEEKGHAKAKVTAKLNSVQRSVDDLKRNVEEK